ncbi:MAG: hypothetical protein ACK2TV_14735 [Anaerolineales bacterium]
MKFKTLMIIKALVCLVLGIPILVFSKWFYGLFGLTLDAASIYPAQQYGASLIGNFLLTWFAQYAKETNARCSIIRGMTVYNAIGFVITLMAVLSGTLNVLGWGPVVIYLFFTLGFGYFWLKPPKP